MKLKIAYWSLYDFANSIVMIAFLFYFSQWLVVDQGRPSWWYNGALVLSSLLFIATAPIVSRKIDVTGKKIGGLRFWTALSILGLGVASLSTIVSDNLDLLAAVLYALGLYAYLMCFLYFTPMLNDLSASENRAKISGIGQGINSLGQVSGLLITLPFADGTITLFGEPGRAQALLVSVVLFALFSLPMMFLYKENAVTVPSGGNKKDMIQSPLSLFKAVFANRPLALLLIAYFFFSDAMLTFSNNFPLYLEKVLGVPDKTKALLTIGILGLASVGAYVFGIIADRKGHKRTLMYILIVYCFLFPVMAFVPDLQTLIPFFLVAGVLFGPVWGISRAMVGQLAPKELTASSFSYYVVAERFATFIGPAVWSAALIVFGEGTRGYQAALISMTILLLISLSILSRVPDETQKT